MWNVDLGGKTVLITGGVRGIGLAIAKEFLISGAKVIVTSKTNKSIEEFKVNNKDDFLCEKLDITNDISIDNLIQSIDALDVLVNSASEVKGGIEYKIENFLDVVNTNLMGVVRMSHECLPKIAISKGSIINISSIFSSLGSANAPGFSTTKTGLLGLTRSMASCWSKHGVRVNCIAPGWIKTKTSEKLITDERDKEKILDRIPLGRYGYSEEVGPAAVFLASDKASYITGTTIFVDGGYSVT